MIPQRDDGAPDPSVAPDHVPASLVEQYGVEARERVAWSRLVSAVEAEAQSHDRIRPRPPALGRRASTIALILTTIVGLAAIIIPVSVAAPFPMLMAGCLVSVVAALLVVGILQRRR